MFDWVDHLYFIAMGLVVSLVVGLIVIGITGYNDYVNDHARMTVECEQRGGWLRDISSPLPFKTIGYCWVNGRTEILR